MRANSKLSFLFQCAILVLPWSWRRGLLQAVLGYRIDKTARIGKSIIMAESVEIGAHATIGHLNWIKGLESLKLGDYAIIHVLNWVNGYPVDGKEFFTDEADRSPSLEVGKHAAVTDRHIIDCSNSVTIGAYSTLGGFATQILTHSIDLKTNRQTSAPVYVGPYSFVGTGSVLLKGSSLRGHTILAAGAVLASKETDEYMLLGGVPAKKLKTLAPEEYKYFSRESGRVN